MYGAILSTSISGVGGLLSNLVLCNIVVTHAVKLRDPACMCETSPIGGSHVLIMSIAS